jgi:hypothetical protein
MFCGDDYGDTSICSGVSIVFDNYFLVLWLWEYWKSLGANRNHGRSSSSSSSSQSKFSRGDLLRFVTGASRAPLDG